MKAIVWTKYGSPDSLRLEEIAKPSPKDNEILIRIRAATVTAGDCEIRSLKFAFWLALPLRILFGFTNPRRKILGQELAGDIEAVGKNVTRFKVGDAVFGTPGLKFAAHAEYTCLPENALLITKPPNMSYEEAAAMTIGGVEALHFLRLGNIQRGEKVLINAGGGSIGTFAIQIAKHYGAEVTAVDSTSKLDMMRSIGADHVIDFTREDFTKQSNTYDVIYDVVGKSSFAGSVNALKSNGRYLLGNAGLGQIIQGKWTSATSGKQVTMGTANLNIDDIRILRDLFEQGKIKPIIDKRYPLADMIEAHKYVESGQKKGHVVITVA